MGLVFGEVNAIQKKQNRKERGLSLARAEKDALQKRSAASETGRIPSARPSVTTG
jgi:hypothetical protein